MFKDMKNILIAFVAINSVGASAGCLTALGPYSDDYGQAIFPFKNDCQSDVTVSLCVKSLPPGSDEPAYNLYSGVVYGDDLLNLADGKFNTLDSYRWTESGYQSCPFE